jgi:peptidoglycan hydrolase CwlO-like protein
MYRGVELRAERNKLSLQVDSMQNQIESMQEKLNQNEGEVRGGMQAAVNASRAAEVAVSKPQMREYSTVTGKMPCPI